MREEELVAHLASNKNKRKKNKFFSLADNKKNTRLSKETLQISNTTF